MEQEVARIPSKSSASWKSGGGSYLDGREVEVESIWGEPLRRAKAAGASVPKLEMLYALLKKLTAR